MACRNRLFGLVRDVRVHGQALRTALTGLQEAVEARAATKHDVDGALQLFQQVLVRCNTEITNRFSDIRDLLKLDAETYDAMGDEITQICNAWAQVHLASGELILSAALQKSTLDPADVAALGKHMRHILEPLHDIVKIAGYLTIPHRLNHHLEGIPRGRPLNFLEVFQDELDPGDLDELFKRLSTYGSLFDGLLDPNTKRVYSASRKSWRRQLSAIQAFVLLALPAVVLALAKWWDGWQLCTKVYLAAAGGLILHFVIGAIKQSRSNDAVSLPLMDWSLWLHVKSFQVTLTILSLWGAVAGLYWLQGDALKAAGVNSWLPLSLAVGYSLDSFVDLFIQRFDSVIEPQIAMLKKMLSPVPKSGQSSATSTTTAAAGATP